MNPRRQIFTLWCDIKLPDAKQLKSLKNQFILRSTIILYGHWTQKGRYSFKSFIVLITWKSWSRISVMSWPLDFSFVISRKGTDMSVGKSYGYIFLHLGTNESILISSFFFFRSVFFLAWVFIQLFHLIVNIWQVWYQLKFIWSGILIQPLDYVISPMDWPRGVNKVVFRGFVIAQ